MLAMANGSSDEITAEASKAGTLKAESPKAPTTEAREAWAVEVQRDAGSKGNLEALVMAIGDSKGLANVAVKLVHVITRVPCGLGGEMAVSRVDKRAVKGHELHVFQTLIRPLVEYAKRKKTSVTYLPVRNDSRDQGIVSAMDLLKAKRVYMPCRKSQLKAFEHLGLLMPGGLLMVAVCAGKRLLEHHVAEVTLVSDGEEGSGDDRTGTGGVEGEREGQQSSRQGVGSGSCRSSNVGVEDLSADLLVDIIGDGFDDDCNNDDARSSVSSTSAGRNRSKGSPAMQGSHSQPFSAASRRHHYSEEHPCAPISVTSYSSLRELSPASSHSSTVSPSHFLGHHPHSHHHHPRSFGRPSPTSAPIPLQPHLYTQGCLNPSSGPIPLQPLSSSGPSPVHSGPVPLERRLTSQGHREPSPHDAYASYTAMIPRETSYTGATPSLSPSSEALHLPAGIDRTQSMSAALLPQRAQGCLGNGGAAARAFVSGSQIPLMPSLSEHSYGGRAGACGNFGGGYGVGATIDGNSNSSGSGSCGPVCQEEPRLMALTLAPGSSIQVDPAVQQSAYGVAPAASDFVSPVNAEEAHEQDLPISFVGAGSPVGPSKVQAPGFPGQRPPSPLTTSPLSATPVINAFARPSVYGGSERRGIAAVSMSSGSIPLGNSNSSRNGGNSSYDTLGSQGIVRSLSSASVILWNRASSFASASDSSSSNLSSPASSGLYPSSSDSRLWSGRLDSSEGGMPPPSAYQGKSETAEDLKRELSIHLADSSLPSNPSPSPPTLRSASGGTVTWKLPGSLKALRPRYLMRGQSDRLRPPLPTSSAASGAAVAPPLPAVLEQHAVQLS